MKDKTVRFRVEGRGAFPLDMLRYDMCYPARGEDAIAMEWDLDPNFRETRSVWLVAHASSAPTIGRWASFGWRVALTDTLPQAKQSELLRGGAP